MYGGRNEVVAVCKDICANRFKKYKTKLKNYMVITRYNKVYTDAYAYFTQIFDDISGYIGDDIFDIYYTIMNKSDDILCILCAGDIGESSDYDVVYNHIYNGAFLYKLDHSVDYWRLERFYTNYRDSKFNDDNCLQAVLNIYITSLNEILSCLPYPSRNDCLEVIDNTIDSIRNMKTPTDDEIVYQKRAISIYQAIKHAVDAFYK